MEQIWRIQLLGRLRVSLGKWEAGSLHRRKSGAILAYLAFHPTHFYARDMLVTQFWPEEETDTAQNRFRVALSLLRQQLTPLEIPAPALLITNRTHIGLNSCACITDVQEFESALQASMQSKQDTDLSPLIHAVESYVGALLPEMEEDWILPERQRLTDAYLGGLQRLVKSLAERQDYDRALEYAHRALKIDPFREGSHRTVMLLYQAIGRPRTALHHYHELERFLKEELHTAPSAKTRALAATLAASPPSAVVRVSSRTGGPIPHRTLPSAASVPERDPSRESNLPPLLTRFFGREEEIGLLQSLLAPENSAPSQVRTSTTIDRSTARLITLMGIGGSGKTRLALEAGRQMLPAYANAVWFVPLADITDPALIPTAIGKAMKLSFEARLTPLEQIVRALKGQPALLILDNLEHLGEPGVRQIQELRLQTPGATLLVTSRQRLMLEGEQELIIQPLPTPIFSGTPERLMEFPCVRLFVDRAQAVQQTFQVTSANAASIASICHRLEGIPLAIELMAAWIRILTPMQIAQQISSRFDLLSSDRKDMTPRHRTMRDTISWSYNLLPTELQHLFASLSVFRGGWTLEAVEAVCSGWDAFSTSLSSSQRKGANSLLRREKAGKVEFSALTGLARLRDCSLILAEEKDGVMRFRQLETLREYAAERRRELCSSESEQRHAAYFLHLAEEARKHCNGPEGGLWLNRLETENENLCAALDWYVSQENYAKEALRLAGALPPLWRYRGYVQEGRERLRQVLDLPSGQGISGERAQALTGAGYLADIQGDFTEALALLEEAQLQWQTLGNSQKVAFVLDSRGSILYDMGHTEEGRLCYEQCLQLCRETEESALSADVLINLATVVRSQDQYDTAFAYLEESRRICQVAQYLRGIAIVHCELGQTYAMIGKQDAAQQAYAEALRLFHEMGEKEGILRIQCNQANLMLQIGDISAAGRLFHNSLQIAHEMGAKTFIVSNLEGLAKIALLEQNAELSARLLGAATGLRSRIGYPQTEEDQKCVENDRCQGYLLLSKESYHAAWEKGKTMRLEDIVLTALAMLKHESKETLNSAVRKPDS